MKKKPTLCVVMPNHWSSSYGGAEFQVKLLLDGLVDDGTFETVFVGRRIAPSFVPKGYRVEQVKCGRFANQVGNIGYVPELLRILKRISPDVIYQREEGAFTGASAYYARNHSCKMLWHVAHDLSLMPFKPDKRNLKRLPFRYIEKKILEYGVRKSDEIVTQTVRQAELLRKNYGRTERVVVPNFHPIPEEPDKDDSEITIVWVANFKPFKQPELFVQVVSKLGCPEGVKFMMIGRSGKTPWHRDLEQSIRDSNCIEYVGELTQDEVNTVFSRAHVFVNTSSFEGFPNTFIQSWLRKVPVVSLNVDPDGVLEKNKIGFLSETPDKMVEHLDQLISNNTLRQEMGIRAREYAIRKHSQENIQGLIQELKNLL